MVNGAIAADLSIEHKTVLSHRVLSNTAQHKPSLLQLYHAVLQQNHLNDKSPQKWAKRARLAAALPRLQLGFRRQLNDTSDLGLTDKVSVSGSGVVIGPRASDFTQSVRHNFAFDVRAVWSLNELIFSPDIIMVSREARARRTERYKILQEVSKLFFSWQRLDAAVKVGRKSKISRKRLKRDQLAAQLDALSGGWFLRYINQGG